MPVPNSKTLPSRDEELREAYQRIDAMEIAIRRLTAEVLRLKAAGEDQEADRIEAELRDRKEHIARDRRIVQLYSPQSERESHRAAPISQCGVDIPDNDQPAEVAELPPIDVAPTRKPSSLAKRKLPRRQSWDIRKQPGWIASVLVHGAILIALGLCTFAYIQNPPPLLASGAMEDTDEIVDALAEISLDPVEAEDPLVEQVDFEAIVPEIEELDVNLPPDLLNFATADVANEFGMGEIVALDAAALLVEVGGGAGDSETTAAVGGPRPTGKGEAQFLWQAIAGQSVRVPDRQLRNHEGRPDGNRLSRIAE